MRGHLAEPRRGHDDSAPSLIKGGAFLRALTDSDGAEFHARVQVGGRIQVPPATMDAALITQGCLVRVRIKKVEGPP